MSGSSDDSCAKVKAVVDPSRVCVCSTSVTQLVGLILFSYLAFHHYKGPPSANEDPLFDLALTIVVLANLVYLYLATLEVEESLIFQLRELHWCAGWMEYSLRCGAFLLLMSWTVDYPTPFKFTLALILLPVAYLLWDGVVYLGTFGSDRKQNPLICHLRKRLSQFWKADTAMLMGALLVMVAESIPGDSVPSAMRRGALLVGSVTALGVVLWSTQLVKLAFRRVGALRSRKLLR